MLLWAGPHRHRQGEGGHGCVPATTPIPWRRRRRRRVGTAGATAGATAAAAAAARVMAAAAATEAMVAVAAAAAAHPAIVKAMRPDWQDATHDSAVEAAPHTRRGCPTSDRAPRTHRWAHPLPPTHSVPCPPRSPPPLHGAPRRGGLPQPRAHGPYRPAPVPAQRAPIPPTLGWAPPGRASHCRSSRRSWRCGGRAAHGLPAWPPPRWCPTPAPPTATGRPMLGPSRVCVTSRP